MKTKQVKNKTWIYFKEKMMEIGAIWLKKTSEGKPYMSMNIEFPGTKIQCAIFKNEQKEKDNQPDYRVVWSPQKKGSNTAGGGSNDSNGFPV